MDTALYNYYVVQVLALAAATPETPNPDPTPYVTHHIIAKAPTGLIFNPSDAAPPNTFWLCKRTKGYYWAPNDDRNIAFAFPHDGMAAFQHVRRISRHERETAALERLGIKKPAKRAKRRGRR